MTDAIENRKLGEQLKQRQQTQKSPQGDGDRSGQRQKQQGAKDADKHGEKSGEHGKSGEDGKSGQGDKSGKGDKTGGSDRGDSGDQPGPQHRAQHQTGSEARRESVCGDVYIPWGAGTLTKKK